MTNDGTTNASAVRFVIRHSSFAGTPHFTADEALLHLDGSSALRAFVDGADDGDGIACVASGNGGLALFADGVAEVLDLAAVALGADGHRVCHAAADVR